MGKTINQHFIKLLIVLLSNATEVLGANNMKKFDLQVAARALIVKNKELLLVSNDGDFWYTPGGRLDPNETLPACIIREIKEETGVEVEPKQIVFVFDFFDKEENIHKVEVYFSAEIQSENPRSWSDQDGPVKFVKFFAIEELQKMNNITPSFLKQGAWLNFNFEIYKGAEVK